MSTDYCVLTYSTDDGSVTEQVWNNRAGPVPQTITLRTGQSAWHSGPDTFHGLGWAPPGTMRILMNWTPGMGAVGGVEIGWPGMPYLFDPEA